MQSSKGAGWIKNPEDIEKIAQSGKILAAALTAAVAAVRPGVSAAELDQIAEAEIKGLGGRASFKGYGGPKQPFPSALCVSVNDVVVHGVPGKELILKEGDIVGLDLGVDLDGFYSDGAVTLPVGKVSKDAERLIEVTRMALEAAIDAARVGNKIGDISHAMQSVAEKAGFSVVRDLIGHGVGYAVHEDPAVPRYGRPGTGPELQAGMVLAIEPMVCAGGYQLHSEPGQWPVRTADGSLAAHFEHTIVITERGPEILTLP